MSSQSLRVTVMVFIRLIAVILAGIMPLSLHAQNYSSNNVKLKLLSSEVLEGHLISMTSDSLSIELEGVKIRTVHYRSVEYVRMYRRSSVNNGFLLGAVAGFAIGYGLNQVSPFTTPAGAGFLGALGGAFIGAFIGSKPKKMFIDGDKKKYDSLRSQFQIPS